MGTVANLVVRITGNASEFTKELQGLEKSWDRTGSKLQSIGTKLTTAITLPLAGVAAGAIKMSTDFETAMTKVRTLASESAGNMGQLKESVLALAPTVGIGPTQLAEALLAIESTGFRGSEALSILEASAKASAIGLGETDAVARAITAAVNAYGIENLNAAQAADILFKTVDVGGAEASELAGELGRVVGVAASLGVSFQEVGAFIATYTRLGLSAAEATTSLSGVLNTILNPSREARDALAGMGLSADSLRQSIRDKGLGETLIGLISTLRGNADATGALFGNVRALAGVMGTAGSQADAYRANLDAITNSQGVLNERFAIWRETTAATWSEFTARVQVAGIALGDELAPSLTRVLNASLPVLDAIVKLTQWFSSLPESVQTGTIGLLAFGAALGPITFAIGKVIGAGSGLLGLLNKLGGASKVLGVLGGAGGLLGGIGLGIGNSQGTRSVKEIEDALRGKLPDIPRLPRALPDLGPLNIQPTGPNAPGFVAGGVVKLAQAWDQAGASFRQASTHAKTLATSLTQALLPAKSISEVGRLMPDFSGFGEAFRTLPSSTDHLEATREEIEALQREGRFASATFAQLGSQVFKGELAPGIDAATTAGAAFRQELAEAEASVPTFGQSVKAVFSDIGGTISDFITSAFTGGGGIVGALKGLASKIGSGIGGAVGSIFGPIGSQIGAGIGSLLGPALGKIKDVFTGGPEWKKIAHDIGRDMGVNISDGLAQAIEQDAKRFGRQIASTLHLTEIIDEAGGIEVFGVEKAIRSTRDLFSFLETGDLTLDQVSSAFDEAFGVIAPAALSKTTGLASAAFVELQQLAIQAGVVSENLDAFRRQQIESNVLGGLQGFLDSAQRIGSQGTATALGDALAAAFGELQRQGAPLLSIIRDMAPLIDQLATRLDEAGFGGGAAFDTIRQYAQLANDEIAGPMLTSMQSLGQVLVGLGNTGLLTQETFTGLTSQIASTFQQLIAQGVNGDAALRLMQPTLQQIWELQQRFGYAVDAATQDLINQGIAAGVVGEQFKSPQQQMVDGLNHIASTLDAIATAMGVELPAAAASAAEQLKNTLGNIDPPPINVDVNFDYHLPGELVPPAEVPEAHRGGMVTDFGIQHFAMGGNVLPFRPRGTDTVPAMLTPGEIVLNQAQQEHVAEGLTGNLAIIVAKSGDPDDILDAVIEAYPTAVRLNRAQARTRLAAALGMAG